MTQVRPAVAYVAREAATFSSFFAERFALFRRQGFDVLACCAAGGEAEVARLGAIHVPIPTGAAPNAARDATAVLLLTAAFLQRRPLLVHSHTTALHLPTALAAKLAQVPTAVATIHGHYGLFAEEASVWSEAYYRLVGGLVSAYCVINQSEDREIRRRGWVDAAKLHFLPTGVGVDVRTFDPRRGDLPGRDEARRRLRLSSRSQWIGFVGRLAAHKAGDLVPLVEDLLAEHENLGIVVVTFLEQDEGHELTNMARAGAPIVVLRDRRLDEMPMLYQAMDVLVLPSYREGASTVAMEASAMEVPVVAYGIAGTRDIVIDDVTGYLVPPGRIDQLSRAVGDLLRGETLRMAMGQRARRHIVDHHCRDDANRRVLALYDELTSESPQAIAQAD